MMVDIFKGHLRLVIETRPVSIVACFYVSTFSYISMVTKRLLLISRIIV